MRIAVLGITLALGASAAASFELVMVADRATRSIHRFDGVSGLYLGAFGNGYVQNPMSMALDQSNNRVFVAEPTDSGTGSAFTTVRVWSFNYNTGEYLNSFTTPFLYSQPQIAYRSGTLAINSSGPYCDRYNSDTGSPTSVFTWPVSGTGLAYQGAKLWSFYGNTVLSRDDIAGTTSTFTMASSVASSSASGQRQLAISGNRALAVGAISYSTFDVSTLTTSGTNAINSPVVSGYLQMNGAGFGHGDIAYVSGVRSGGGGGIDRILYSSRISLQNFWHRYPAGAS